VGFAVRLAKWELGTGTLVIRAMANDPSQELVAYSEVKAAAWGLIKFH
jgi:hypothetical protein